MAIVAGTAFIVRGPPLLTAAGIVLLSLGVVGLLPALRFTWW